MPPPLLLAALLGDTTIEVGSPSESVDVPSFTLCPSTDYIAVECRCLNDPGAPCAGAKWDVFNSGVCYAYALESAPTSAVAEVVCRLRKAAAPLAAPPGCVEWSRGGLP